MPAEAVAVGEVGHRARPRRRSFSVEQFEKRLDAQERSLSALRGDVNLQTGALQRIETAMGKILGAVGEESEDGDGGYKGTGLMGRTRRNEKEVDRLKGLYHRWIAYGWGFVTCAGILGGGSIAVFWWAFGDKLAIVLRGH